MRIKLALFFEVRTKKQGMIFAKIKKSLLTQDQPVLAKNAIFNC